MVCVQYEEAFAALIQACHRALDDLCRLEATKPIVCVDAGAEHNESARGQGLLCRWRSAEPGHAEERCFILRIP
jgi:hypothetical protein